MQVSLSYNKSAAVLRLQLVKAFCKTREIKGWREGNSLHVTTAARRSRTQASAEVGLVNGKEAGKPLHSLETGDACNGGWSLEAAICHCPFVSSSIMPFRVSIYATQTLKPLTCQHPQSQPFLGLPCCTLSKNSVSVTSSTWIPKSI